MDARLLARYFATLLSLLFAVPSTASDMGKGSSISHGAQLTRSMVGPKGLGVEHGQLRKTSVAGQRIGIGSPLPSWIPNTAYAYNNDPANRGGIVSPEGMMIDGFKIPGGTWVAQFNDFDDQIIINGAAPSPGIVFRGCRWRGAWAAPGPLNLYAKSKTSVWLLYNEAGGLGSADNQTNEVAFTTNASDASVIFFRNYISYTTTGIQPGSKGPQLIENYIERISYYYGDAGPPNQLGPYHLNGISFNGGQTNALVLRNKITVQSPDDSGRTISQTDALGFFQDFGAFIGTGTNIDGSVGYQVRDNFLGGGGYTIYAGLNPGKSADTVQNMVVTGNVITRQWWPAGGRWGPIAAQPKWGFYGNIKTNNRFEGNGRRW